MTEEQTHKIGATTFDATGRADVQCACGHAFGYIRKAHAPRGGTEYDIYNRRSERIVYGQRTFDKALAVFHPEYVIHVRRRAR